jgi:hypothetical protein
MWKQVSSVKGHLLFYFPTGRLIGKDGRMEGATGGRIGNVGELGGFAGATGEEGEAEAEGNADEDDDGTSLTTIEGVEEGWADDMAEALPGAAKAAAGPPAGSKSL